MLTVVFYDIRIFLLILAIVYFGFGEATLRISEVSQDEGKFLDSYAHAWVMAYQASLGNGDTSQYDSSL